MARPLLIRTDRYPYHVSARSNNKDWFYLPRTQLWPLIAQIIDKVSIKYHAHVISVVLMDNHFHMIIWTPERNLDSIMQYLLRETSKLVGLKSGRINRIFGPRYKRSVLYEPAHFVNAFKYVYRNPVAAGMCSAVEEHIEGSLLSSIGRVKCAFPLSGEPSELLREIPSDPSELLRWLNTPYKVEEAELIRRGLRHREFRWTQDKAYRRPLQDLLSQRP